MVIFVKFSSAKAFNAVGLFLLTLQILVYLFEYLVISSDIVGFFVNTWAGLFGYVLLVSLFIRNAMSSDFILTLIGCLLWVVQFVRVFRAFPKEPSVALLYCVAGLLGLVFIVVALFAHKSEKKNIK